MTINEWWQHDPAERYWMEITDRLDLGADLHAPQRDDAGQEYWSYALVTAVRRGDVVLHWHKRLRGQPGIVGYSIASEGPMQDEILWNAHGSYGRARPATAPEPSWRFALTGYTALATIAGQDDFRATELVLRRVRDGLRTRHTGPLYYPFAFSDLRPVRAAQGYLVKFPAEIVASLPMLLDIPHPDGAREGRSRAASDAAEEARSSKRARSGRLADKRLQLAIERHAVEWAMRHYVSIGYDVVDVGATQSYDVLATKGTHELHVEVKGSSATVDAVELTTNEVEHGRRCHTDLVVVDRIGWRRVPDGSVETYAGRARHWRRWSPDDELLRPTRYRYQLPHHDEEVDVTEGSILS